MTDAYQQFPTELMKRELFWEIKILNFYRKLNYIQPNCMNFSLELK